MNSTFNFNFNGLTSSEAKETYRKLAMQYHPDRGGDLEQMKQINMAYADFLSKTAREEAWKRTCENHEQGKKGVCDFNDMDKVQKDLFEKIQAILNLSGDLEVELCGLWVWVGGDTRPVKDSIKAQGFRWSHDKGRWYYAGVPSFSKKPWSMDAIRDTYGSTKFEKKEQGDLALA